MLPIGMCPGELARLHPWLGNPTLRNVGSDQQLPTLKSQAPVDQLVRTSRPSQGQLVHRLLGADHSTFDQHPSLVGNPPLLLAMRGLVVTWVNSAHVCPLDCIGSLLLSGAHIVSKTHCAGMANWNWCIERRVECASHRFLAGHLFGG